MLVRQLALCAVFAVVALGLDATGQGRQADGTLAITGTVVDATTAAPVANARVVVLTRQNRLRTVTDASGAFTVSNLASGSYTIAVAADGYIPASHGQMWPAGPGRSVSVSVGSVARPVIRAWRHSSIEGVVLGSDGQPLSGTSLQLFAVTAGNPDRLVASTPADNGGNYRFSNLTPGRYVLVVVQTYSVSCRAGARDTSECSLNTASSPAKAPEADRVFPTTFFPSAKERIDATVISLRAGERRLGVDLTLEAVRTFVVSGQVDLPNPKETRTTVSLVRVGNGGLRQQPRHVITSADASGRFFIPGVPEGAYELRVAAYPRNGSDIPPQVIAGPRGTPVIYGFVGGIKQPSVEEPILEGMASFSVTDSDVDGVSVVLQRAASIQGIVVISDGTARRSPTPTLQGSVMLQPVSSLGSALGGRTTIEPGGTFAFPSLQSGDYSVAVSGLPGYLVRALELNGVADRYGVVNIECCRAYSATLVLDEKLATVQGTITSDSSGGGNPAVFLFPDDALREELPGLSRRYRFAPVASNGSFSIANVGPGRYFVTAVNSGVFDFDWTAPENLARLERSATRVAVTESTGTVSVQLEAGPIRVN